MKRHLITSALPYINGIKHLGNLVGSMLPADVYAKFLRQKGEKVLFICGTDEHGTPAEIAAHAKQQSIEVYCSQMYETQKSIYERFGIDFDFFGRSSSLSNHNITKEIFLSLKQNGYIQEKEIQQYYSHDDQRFLPDRYVEGTCPHCSYAKARGDQCDGCGSLLDPTELMHPFSTISGSRNIELQHTKHLFLNLNQLETELEKWVKERSGWPDVVKSIAKKWLNEGLQPRCITRDLKWGIEVPLPGFENKVFYVWFDAPNAYISMTQDWAKVSGNNDAWKEWWLAAEEVHYTQFMAKDNVPFHAIFWPAMLLAADLGFKQVDYIKGFHWLTYDKGKFSTSQKRGVFTDAALTLYPADYWRYYLLANCPETSDADFTFAHFALIINKDLADILGNFTNRVLTLFQKYFDSTVPFTLEKHQIDSALSEKIARMVSEFSENLSSLKFRQAAQILRSIWVLGNEYITKEQPWETFKTDREKSAITLIHCIHLLRLFAVISYCFIPFTSKQLLSLLKDSTNPSQSSFEEAMKMTFFSKGHLLNAPARLFTKIEELAVEDLTKMYG